MKRSYLIQLVKGAPNVFEIDASECPYGLEKEYYNDSQRPHLQTEIY